MIVRAAALGLIGWGSTAVATADGDVTDARIGLRIAPILLLTRDDVRDELKLRPDQASEAERFIARIFAEAQAIQGRNDQAATQARQGIDHASQKWIREKLDADQRKRLHQLDIQWEGPSAIVTRAIVAESLRLTDDQTALLKKAVGERNARRKYGRPVAADESRLRSTALSILTEPQRELWSAIIGPEFFFQVATREPAVAPIRR